MLLDLSFHGLSNDGGEFLLGLLLVFVCLMRPGLVAAIVVAVFLTRITAVLGMVRSIGSVSLAVVRRLLLILLTCLGLLGVLLLGLRFGWGWFNTLDVFHEVHDLRDRLAHGIKPLTFHLVLPRTRCSKEQNVQEFIFGQLLVSSKRRQVG